jgi:4-hydroxy-tetrahydrodipicolinate reductase
MTIRVVVHGAAGRMGQEIINGLSREPDIQVVGAVDIKVEKDSISLPNNSIIPFSSNLEAIITSTNPNVVVDFSLAKATLPAVRTATAKNVNVVVGTTGLSTTDLEEIGKSADAHKVGVVVAPNFALGAVLMMHLAKIAAKYMDYAEIIELHHHLKADAPSGTAQLTAKSMVQSRGKPFSRATGQGPAISRGQELDGVSIHSVRLPGFMAHQEVIFGTAGQTLTIRHDTINRECYLPGIIIAVKEVSKHKGLVYGLDTLLNL